MNEPRWRRYLRFWRRDPARDVDEELRFHFTQRIAQYEAEGASHEEATASARERFGDVTEVRAELIDVEQHIARRSDLTTWIDAVWQDIRYAVRALRRQPAFVAAVVMTLSLAIGVNLSVFSLLDALFFRPPAGVVNAGSLRRLYTILPNFGRGDPAFPRFEYSEFQAIRDAANGIARVAIDLEADSVEVGHEQSVTVTSVSYATADLLPLLGVRVERGRVFSEAEEVSYPPAPVAVISRRFADRMIGVGANPLGREVRILNRTYRVIGVIASPFVGLGSSETSVWIPFNHHGPQYYRWRGTFSPLVMRMLPGIEPRAVEVRATLAYRILHPLGYRYQGATIVAGPLAEARGPQHQTRDVIIATRIGGASFILLVIACANCANLLLAFWWTRRREFAIRVALGISRARLATLLFLEWLVLAAAAGGIALFVGRWTVGMFSNQLFRGVPWSGSVVGSRTLVINAAITLVAVLLAGMAPALFASRHAAAADSLKFGTRFNTAHRGRLRSSLLALQSALAVVLLVSALLFGKSLRNVRDVDLGYDGDRLVIAAVEFVDRERHPEAASLLRALAEQIAALPGVAGAMATSGVPLVRVVLSPDLPWNELPRMSMLVGPDYFRLTGTRMLEGRSFLPSDTLGSEPVVIVGSNMAFQLWPWESAIGHCFRLGSFSSPGPCHTVVGVAENVHILGIVSPDPATQVYLPFDQLPNYAWPRTLIVRAGTSEPDVIADVVRHMLRRAFPSEQVRAVAMTRALEPEMRQWILGARLFALLSAFAVLVAIIGVYAMTTFDARQRTREIGVRIALGASGASVISIFLRDGTAVVVFGVVLGAVVAFAGGRFVESALYGVSSRDPVLLVGSAAALLLVAVAASVVSAWRATRVDPVVVLRDE